jgi:hypothetical protein
MAGPGRTRVDTDTTDGRLTCEQRVAALRAVDLMAI